MASSRDTLTINFTLDELALSVAAMSYALIASTDNVPALREQRDRLLTIYQRKVSGEAH